MKCVQATIIICGGFYTAALWGQATNVFPSSGNVGIGTTTPTSALQVVGSANFSGNVSATNGFNVGGTSVANGYFPATNYGSAAFLDLFGAGGTQAALTALAAGAEMGTYSGLLMMGLVGVGGLASARTLPKHLPQAPTERI